MENGKVVRLMRLDIAPPHVSGADVNVGDQYGMTPLHRAVYHNRVEVARVLIASGADLNAQDYRRETPLTVFPSSSLVIDCHVALHGWSGGVVALGDAFLVARRHFPFALSG